MVLCAEVALRDVAAGLQQPVVHVVDVVLLAQAAAAADKVAPGVVAVKQPLPVRQPVADHRDGRRIDQVVRLVVLQAAGQRIVAFNTLPPVPLLASRISPFTVLTRIKPDTTSVRFFHPLTLTPPTTPVISGSLHLTPHRESKRGPASRLEQQIELIGQLPGTKQKLVSEILDNVIGKAQ